MVVCLNLFLNPVGFVWVSNYSGNVPLHLSGWIRCAHAAPFRKFDYAMKLEPMKEAPWKNDSFIIPFNEFALLSFLTSELIA